MVQRTCSDSARSVDSASLLKSQIHDVNLVDVDFGALYDGRCYVVGDGVQIGSFGCQ